MCRDTTKEDLLFRFMKTYSVKEAMALKTLNEYHIKITRQQIDFARNRMKGIRANNKRKRVHRKERKQRLLEEKEYQAYKAVSYTHLDVYKRQIYIWSKSGEQKQISEKQACEAIVPYVKSWLNMINETCAPIIESGDCLLYTSRCV